jgi:5-methylcytosine-specific restriction endonuclease McrBC regulatory subunit McrC
VYFNIVKEFLRTMKSLKSIAQQKRFDLKKLTQLVDEIDDLSPVNMGGTKLFSADDVRKVVNAYNEKHVITNS